MVQYKISYFDGRNLGEPARLILRYAAVEFEDDRFTWDEWPARKEEMPYGKVPVLWVDGMSLTQSHAIFRYLGNKYGLYGNSDWDKAKIDEIADYHKDVSIELCQYLYKKLGFEPGNAVKFSSVS